MDSETSFLLLMGVVLVNVVCWGVVLLRVIQNLDTSAAKVVLIAQIGVPIGFTAAFIYGWVRRDLKLRNVMLIWSAAIAALIVLAVIDTIVPTT